MTRPVNIAGSAARRLSAGSVWICPPALCEAITTVGILMIRCPVTGGDIPIGIHATAPSCWRRPPASSVRGWGIMGFLKNNPEQNSRAYQR